MINTLIHETFKRIGHSWNIGGKQNVPTESDVEKVLDTAAAKLYDGSVGDRLETGGLIIEKATTGFDVYVYVGTYH